MALTPLAGIPAFDPIAAVTPFTTRDNASYLAILEKLRLSLVGLITDYNSTVAQTAAERETLRVGVNTAIAAANEAIEEAAASAAAAELSASLVNAPADDIMALLLNNTGSDAHAAVADIFTLLFPDAIDARIKGNDPDVYASRYLPGAATDLAALQAARDAAVARGGRLVIDDIGRDWTIADSLKFDTLSNVSVHMEGRIKRADNSARTALLHFLNCTGVRVGVLRTNGNVANNGYNPGTGLIPVDEAKHDVRVEGCVGVAIARVSSLNPAGDAVYVTGTSANVWFGHIRSQSDAATGRNTLSVVQGDTITVDSLVCLGTGYTTMPGGLDIEPNTGQSVSNFQIGSGYVRTKGTSGCNVFGNYTGSGTLGAGVRQCTNISIGNIMLVKDAGVGATANDVLFKGVSHLSVNSLTIKQDAGATNYAIGIDDADNVAIMNLQVPRSNKVFNIGVTAMVDGLYLRGSYVSTAGVACLNITNLNNADINMRLRCTVAGGVLVVKQAGGASAGVRFRGDWRKDGTAGTGCLQVNGVVSDWILDAVDMTGWTANRVLGAQAGAGIKKLNVRGLNFGTAIPGNTGDTWIQGDRIENETPAAGGTPGWVCTTGGAYGTFVFKAMANLAA